jgi:hypothetical protein
MVDDAPIIEAVRAAIVAVRTDLSPWHDEWNPPCDAEARVLVAAFRAYDAARKESD